jgi:hypothetical protein
MAMVPVYVDGVATEMDERALHKLKGGYESDNEIVGWVQYHLKSTGAMVHRSAHVHLKRAIFGEGMAAEIG